MSVSEIQKAPAYAVLAQMGKKVLRPGGKESTQKLISELNINSTDDVLELAPGMGYTALLALAKKPNSYTGVDTDKASIKKLQEKISGKNIQFVLGTASATTIESNTKTKVYGEAMLTMQTDHKKSEIIREAYRILKPEGLFAIHELGLTEVNETLKNKIQKDLAQTVKVNTRPLTQTEWKVLLEQEGFVVKNIFIGKMHLLEPKRIIDDEGFFRTLKIGFNIITTPAARKRILEIRNVFSKHRKHTNSVVIIAEKIITIKT